MYTQENQPRNMGGTNLVTNGHFIRYARRPSDVCVADYKGSVIPIYDSAFTLLPTMFLLLCKYRLAHVCRHGSRNRIETNAKPIDALE
jgi:hypothetical protein